MREPSGWQIHRLTFLQNEKTNRNTYIHSHIYEYGDRMGVVIKPIISYARTESGKLVVWYDKTMNYLLRRTVLMEVKE